LPKRLLEQLLKLGVEADVVEVRKGREIYRQLRER
jgi:hypothetical protein